MQPFLDGALSEAEVAEAEAHLGDCRWCAKRYRFEERLRHYVRVATMRADAARAEGEARGAPHAAQLDVESGWSMSPGGAQVGAGDEQRLERAGALVGHASPRAARASTTGWLRAPS